MAKRLDKEGLEQALKNLGELLERDSEAEAVHLVVCGGSSLLARQMLENRQFTRDVDVLAIVEEEGENALVSARPLPESLLRAARTTAQVMDLFEDWINDGPTDLLDGGLPRGFVDRLEPREFGTRLKVSFIGRHDQVHFKVYAATDLGGGRHFSDLQELQPSADELQAAIRWIRETQDPSEGFAEMLKNLVKALNHDELVDLI